MFKTQTTAHEGLEENLPEGQVQKWKQTVETWLQNPGTGQDPFKEPRTSKSFVAQLDAQMVNTHS